MSVEQLSSKERLFLLLAAVALLLALVLPSLPVTSANGDLVGVSTGVVHADGPTPTPQDASCQGGAQCGG